MDESNSKEVNWRGGAGVCGRLWMGIPRRVPWEGSNGVLAYHWLPTTTADDTYGMFPADRSSRY